MIRAAGHLVLGFFLGCYRMFLKDKDAQLYNANWKY
jgi:hypothetical protein